MKAGRILLVLLCVIGIYAGCASDIKVPTHSQIEGLATPVNLGYEETEIVLQDYFNNPELIDSVKVPEGLTATLSNHKDKLLLSGSLAHKLGVLEVQIKGIPYHLLLKKSEKTEVTFTFNPKGVEYGKVQIKGEMNNWNPTATPLEKEGNVWTTTMLLSNGVYQYLFVVDGKETLDSSNPETVPNGKGGTNSLLRVGGVLEHKPVLLTKDFSANSIKLHGLNIDEIIAFWDNFEIEVKKKEHDFEIQIPRSVSKFERSYIRVWAYNEEGLSNDILIPLRHGFVLESASQLTRHDFQAWNMYFVLVDRFKDGNPSNTEKVNDPEINPKANYYGGDLAGITQTIKDGYFKKIGVNTLWISPISQNPETAYGLWDKGGVTTKFSGYHGYWPISSSKVDHRFGTAAELDELLEVAHEHNMNVILDYVANHVHELHPVYQKHKDWATDLYLPDGTLNTEKWEEYRLTTWFDTFMPTLDFSKPEVIDAMTDSALFWVKEFDLDGFRHDATKHIQLEFWRTLTHKIKTQITIPTGKQVFQIGETYGGRELIASYINSGMLDSQFDFNIYDAGLNSFGRGESFKGLETQLMESFNYYGYHNLMGYISGNHDKTRFISLTSGEVKWNEDGKLAGWTREIGTPGAFGYDRLSMFHAFNQTIPGIPVTYYGDEFGMPGANDPDNRRWMKFDDSKLSELELKNRAVFTKLAKLRNTNLALIYGDFQFLTVQEDIMAYSRTYFHHQVIVVFNKSGAGKNIEVTLRPGFDYTKLKTHFGHSFEVEEGTLTLTLSPNSFEILTM